MSAPATSPFRRWEGWILLLAGTVAQAALARLCVIIATMEGNISPVWPATGLGIWMLIVRGPGMWPAIATGQVLISLHSQLPLSVALGMGAGNALEALLGAWLWHTAATRWRPYFGEHTALVGSFVVAAIAPLAAASAGNLALWLGGIIPAAALAQSWLTWWVGDALGALFVVPLLLDGPVLGRWLRTGGRSEWNRVLAVLAAMGAVCALAFFVPRAGAFLFGVFPVLLLAARWLPAPASGAVAALVAIAAVVGTAGGHGPFATGDINLDLINLQVFLAAVATIARLLPTLHGRGSIVPSLILLVGWTASGGLLAALQSAQLRETRANFAALTTNAAADIEGRLGVYVDALRGGASHLIAAPATNRAGWRAFFESLRINERYPGVYGYGVIFPVAPADTESFEQRMRADGEPEFTIRPVKGAPAAKDREHFVITHAAAGSEHRRSLGLDIATETVRREAAEAARASGEPRITGRITLTVKEVKHAGFLLLLPVYRPGQAVTTAAEREAAFLAWIYAPFLMDEFIPGALQKQSRKLQVHLFAGDRTDEGHLLYRSTPAGPQPTKFQRVTTLQLAGQSFTLGWNPGTDFVAAQPAAPVWTMVGLAFGTLLLAAFVRSLQNFRERAEALTAERTRELREEMIRRETADRTLTAMSALQSAILNSASTAIISTTPEGLIEVFNPAAERLLGYTAEEMVGRQTPALFHDPEEVVARAAEFSGELGCIVEPGFDVFVIKACRGLPNEHEWTYIRRDGVRVPVLLSVTPLTNRAGEFTGFLGMAVDISARRKADYSLRHERHLLRTIIDTVPAAIFVKDREGRYVLSNRAHADSLGAASPAEVVGKTMDDYYPRESNSTFADSDRDVMENGCTYFEVEENERRPGRSGNFTVTKVALRDTQGQVVGLVGIRHDITALKANEADLLAARRAAEAASVAKSEFLATMSHEIRTPMNAVVGFTELLMDTPLEAEQRNYIEIIRASGQNLIALINDILDFSKIEAGKLEVDHVRFDGIDVVESVAKTLSLQAKSKGLWLRFVSSPQTPRILVGDTGRLRQVLINLVGNALKFTATGGVTLSVAETTTALGLPMLRVSVTDTGIGISAEKQSKLFDKFSQADSSVTREFGGTGLGLAISKRLVELMGGTIGLASVADSGSTFWCELPLSVDQSKLSNEPVALELAPSAAESPAPQRRRRVLVADDNRLNQVLVKKFLAKLHCDAVPAVNGIEALHLVKAGAFDFVLMDHQMPVMDGCEAAQAIRAWERDQGHAVRLPIIALTANASETGESFYRAAGMDGYLTKPLLMHELKQAIESIDAASTATAAPTPFPREPIVDYARALALADQDRNLLGLLAGAFLGQSDELMTTLRQAIGARDVKALRTQAHKLKGAVSCFAADTLTAAAHDLETSPDDPDWPRLDAQGARLEGQVQQLLRELSELPHSPRRP